jgi:hypothetical protein
MAGLADALAGEEMDPETDGAMGADPEAPEGDGLGLGAADETELDPIFAADAGDVFPDLDDTQLLALQKLIDSRIAAGAMPMAEPDTDDMGGEDMGMSFGAEAL